MGDGELMEHNAACPPNAPVALADGKLIMPDDQVTLADLCELIPLILETMAAAQGGGGGGAGLLVPGAQVPIAGAPMLGPFGTPALPSNTSPFGPPKGSAIAASGGGGGFGGGGGGGGRGARGLQGPAGPAGAPGPGTIVPMIKTDGNFTVASVSPFLPIPGTQKKITLLEAGPAIFLIQGVFGGNSIAGVSNGQIGLRVDGTDYPLTANLIHTFVGGVGEFLASATANFPIMLAAGEHDVELIVRGDSSLGAPTGLPVVVQATPAIPLALTIIHK